VLKGLSAATCKNQASVLLSLYHIAAGFEFLTKLMMMAMVMMIF